MSENTFRQLRPDELSAAYDIVLQATRWLRSIGSPQWSQPMPPEVYQKRQERGQNFGFFVDGELALVMTLKPELPEYWHMKPPEASLVWLCTFAGADKFRHQGFGQAAVKAAESYIVAQNIPAVYLDCFYDKGALPRFYEAIGYEQIARQDEIFVGITFDIILMRKQLKLTD